jgi:hypothetical protein
MWLFYFFILLSRAIDIANSENYSSLHDIWQAKPDSIKIDRKCHYFPIHARLDFFNGKWDELYRNSRTSAMMEKRNPLYSYKPCLTKYNLGNVLGHYFHEIFCAIDSSTNLYISQLTADNPHVPLEFQAGALKSKYRNRPTYHSEENSHLGFFQMLPYEIDVDYNPLYYRLVTTCSEGCNYTVEYLISKGDITAQQSEREVLIHHIEKHTSPSSRHLLGLTTKSSSSSSISSIDSRIIEARARLQTRCKCEQYCWTDRTAPWTRYYRAIQVIMKEALHFNAIESVNMSLGSILKPEFDLYGSLNLNSSLIAVLPVIPDIAIHYRCGDQVPSDVYGFLSFSTILSIIQSQNSSPSSIYILSDHPKRAGILFKEPPFTAHCKPILERLRERLSLYFPNASVIVFRGSDPILDQTRLAEAKLTICSISTFCLWPAIANSNRVYFPATPLAGGPRGKDIIVYPYDEVIESTVSKDDVVVSNHANDTQLPYFGSNFYWIKKPAAIIEFQASISLANVLRVLDPLYM